jgi:hypothetical protein
MRIDLTTPMSDDKERERHTKAVIDAIERYTDERMAVDYVCEPADDSRSGVQPVQSDVNERLGAWLSAALDDPNCSDAFKQDINDWFASQPTQSDALREALRNIQIEAEREKGSWVHLKRVIALNCKAALQGQANDRR